MGIKKSRPIYSDGIHDFINAYTYIIISPEGSYDGDDVMVLFSFLILLMQRSGTKPRKANIAVETSVDGI